MVQVSADTFLTKAAELYEQSAAADAKGSVAISCKSVPMRKLAKAARDKALGAGDHALLFRVCKYGNNKHKKKYSTVITAAGHAQFHAALSQIIKTKADVATLKDVAALGAGAKRVVKAKKTTT